MRIEVTDAVDLVVVDRRHAAAEADLRANVEAHLFAAVLGAAAEGLALSPRIGGCTAAAPGAPKGEANGNYRHGCFSNEAIELRRELNEWARLMKKFAEEVE